jgi:hypothetical protein
VTRRLYTGGYVYHSDPHAQLERTPERCSLDRWTVAIIAALLVATFAGVIVAITPAASSAPTPRADAPHASSVEARPGRDLPR